MNLIQKSLGLLSLCACVLVPVSLRAEVVFHSVSGFSDAQGENGWSYAGIKYTDKADLRGNATASTYNATEEFWATNFAGVGPVIMTAGQQRYIPGNAHYSLRYWTADQDYSEVTYSSSMTADTNSFVGVVYYSTLGGTQVQLRSQGIGSIGNSAQNNSADIVDQTISGATIVSGGVIENVSAGDRIYFSMQNTGTANDGTGFQTWTMEITAIP